MDYDQTQMPAAYDAGRGYRPAILSMWLDVIARRLQGEPIDDILDVGCGTGRYSAALADRFDARVIAVDPSAKMLAEARKKLVEIRAIAKMGRDPALERRQGCFCSYFGGRESWPFLAQRRTDGRIRRSC